MGCCLSSNTSSRKTPHISDSKSAGKRSGFSKSPPPTHPIVEEEAVKEVLSETPTVPKHYPASFQPNRPNESLFIKSEPPLPDFSTAQNGVVRNKPSTTFSNDDRSELSEICSDLSESASISTAVAETGENIKGEFRRRSRNPPYTGEIKIRERSVGVSPGRRSEISPNRSGSGYGRKRDSGEISGRRSRSPAAMRAEAATSAQTGPGRKTGRSPGRIGPERIRKAEEGKEGGWPPTSKESLENPLVSLECFIFL